MSRFLKSLKFAMAGIAYGFKTQRHIRFHLFAGLIAITAGYIKGLDKTEWAVLICLIGAIVAAEFLNTAIETVVDLVSPEYHPLAKAAKDTAAAAVLILAMVAVVIGILLFAV
ncbi:MAG: diacylglycerol kinase family protein [Trichlorobacter sp.]|nr:diacylglycerol kinase family protein [Trichlorobacter sp.]